MDRSAVAPSFPCAAILSAPILLARPVSAHQALPTAAKPLGWSYPYSCCSGIDCRQVSNRAISERPEGYVINRTGEVVAYSDSRVKNSPDGVYHWCSVAGGNDSKTIRLFVPPKGILGLRTSIGIARAGHLHSRIEMHFGVYPAVMIEADSGGRRFQEMRSE